VFWLDNGYSRDGATLHRAAKSGTGQPELIAVVSEGYVRSLAAVRGALWVAPQMQGAVLRVDPNGDVERFAVPYTALSLAALADQLVVMTAEEPRRLLLQPLD
jgi:hypothetical protein